MNETDERLRQWQRPRFWRARRWVHRHIWYRIYYPVLSRAFWFLKRHHPKGYNRWYVGLEEFCWVATTGSNELREAWRTLRIWWHF
jgi:hypothetical protein